MLMVLPIVVAWIDCGHAQCGVVLVLAHAFLQENLTNYGIFAKCRFPCLAFQKIACMPHAGEQVDFISSASQKNACNFPARLPSVDYGSLQKCCE